MDAAQPFVSHLSASCTARGAWQILWLPLAKRRLPTHGGVLAIAAAAATAAAVSAAVDALSPGKIIDAARRAAAMIAVPFAEAVREVHADLKQSREAGRSRTRGRVFPEQPVDDRAARPGSRDDPRLC